MFIRKRKIPWFWVQVTKKPLSEKAERKQKDNISTEKDKNINLTIDSRKVIKKSESNNVYPWGVGLIVYFI